MDIIYETAESSDKLYNKHPNGRQYQSSQNTLMAIGVHLDAPMTTT